MTAQDSTEESDTAESSCNMSTSFDISSIALSGASGSSLISSQASNIPPLQTFSTHTVARSLLNEVENPSINNNETEKHQSSYINESQQLLKIESLKVCMSAKM